MTVFLLVRHGLTDLVGRVLAGRTPGVHLNQSGYDQARSLLARLRGVPVAHVYSSPLERAVETASPLAESLGVPVMQAAELNEVNFGEWTGKAFAELERDPLWVRYHGSRESEEPPGGECLQQAQSRILSWLAEAQTRHDAEVVALFSHADIIKAALVGYLCAPLQTVERLEISPGSVSVVEYYRSGPRILAVNSVLGLPWAVAGF
jgi:broad specificity phosphatase PhoE